MKIQQKAILLTLKIYLLVLSIFSIFRLLLFFSGFKETPNDKTTTVAILNSFIMGIRFDVVIASYILILPTFLLIVFELLNLKNAVLKKISYYWIAFFFTITFLVSAADIPFFIQFNDRFNIGAFQWLSNFDTVFAMIIQEPRYYMVVFPFIILLLVFYLLLKKIFKQTNTFLLKNTIVNIVLSILFLGLMFLGVRGRTTESPIRIGTAYISDNTFLNKMGLNPSFTLLRSYLDEVSAKDLFQLMDDDKAVNYMQNTLHVTKPKYQSPIARLIKPDTIATVKPNVVIVIMESMSVAKMTYFGNTHNITPFLDSLSSKSLFFTKMYSAGKHTYNGIFSTLYSFPALFREHTMTKIRHYGGLPKTLLKNGYSTIFFATHDGRFDNEEGFLRANSFEQVISQKNYPKKEIKTPYGVPDDFMFRFAVPVLTELAKKEKPFLATFMTTSDHGPYYVPPYFHPKATETLNKSTEYADWSLRKFLTLASKETWYDNTIFVFIADHGQAINPQYDIPLNYFHIPLLIYTPNGSVTNKKYEKMAAQIDVYPTLMGLLKQPYINNTLGIDLLKDTRKYVLINNDDNIGVLDTINLCIMKNKLKELSLYNYSASLKNNYIKKNKHKADEMTIFAKAMLQVTKKMLVDKTILLDSI